MNFSSIISENNDNFIRMFLTSLLGEVWLIFAQAKIENYEP